jgi:hypothetical protein
VVKLPQRAQKRVRKSIHLLKDRTPGIAYWESLTIKDTFEEAAIDRVKKYEKRSGPLKPQPNKR